MARVLWMLLLCALIIGSVVFIVGVLTGVWPYQWWGPIL